MKVVIRILVGIAVLVLAYLCVMSILTPELFKKEQEKREVVIQKRLKDIASYELAYREVHGKFASADELVAFLESGQIFVINADGDYTDAMREKGLSEEDAARQGLIKRDTMYISAKDSLLKNGEIPSELIMIPGFESQRIDIQASVIPQEVGNDTINVAVFQAGVPMEIYLADMDTQIRENKIRDAKARNNGKGYPGLVIGSLEEAKTTGNWE